MKRTPLTRRKQTAGLRKNSALADAAIDILMAEQPITLRGLLYRLVSCGALASTDASEYRRLGRLMTLLREQRRIPRTWIVDNLRQTIKPSSWSGLAEFGETIRRAYRKDYWGAMPAYPCVFVEKDAIAATIEPVTRENDVRLHVCRGYASVSFAGEIADEWAAINKTIYAYYLGDYDASGFDIERDLREKLQRYSGKLVTDADASVRIFAGGVFWKRLGVCRQDFDDHNLIRLAVKHKDRRAAAFVERYGSACAEVDAIPPTELRRRVTEAIDLHIDVDQWNRLVEVEEAEKETLERFTAAWGKASA